MKTFGITIVMIALLGQVFAAQCQNGNNANKLKTLMFNNTNGIVLDDMMIYDIELDAISKDVFYLGYQGFKFFVSRLVNEDQYLWFKEFSTVTVIYSLMYSKSYDKVYFSTVGLFTLVTLNSTTGSVIESIQIVEARQNYQELSCSLTNDETLIFCNVHSPDEFPGVLRYDNSFSSVSVAFYSLPSALLCKDLITISSQEVFFSLNHFHDYNFVRGSFNYTSDRFEENYFVTMEGPSVAYGTAARVDDALETVWQVVASSDIVYFQRNITDFSVIGSKYATGTTITSPEIIDMSISQEYVFVLFIANGEGYLMNINSSSRNVIWVASNDADNILYSLFAIDGYINIVESQLYGGSHYAIHNEIDPSLEINLYPTFNFNMTSELQFSESNDIKLEFNSNDFYNNIISYLDKTPVEFTMTDGVSTFTIIENLSYIASMPENLTQNITVSVGQNYTENISLPCSIDAYDNLKHSTYYNGVDEVPTWVTPDYDLPVLDIKVPVTNQARNYTYIVETTYPEGTVFSYFYIFVIECNISDCESCSEGLCISCASEYELSSDSLSCESVSNNSEANTQTDVQTSSESQYNATTATTSMQIASGLGAIVGFANSLASTSSSQGAWAIINMLQLILLLPLFSNFISSRVQNFILSNRFFSFSLCYIDYSPENYISFIKSLSFLQPIKYIKMLGMTSGSALINNLLFFIVILCILIVNVVVLMLFVVCKKCDNCVKNFIIMKLVNFMTFTIYLRIFIESYTFILLVTVVEIKYYGIDDIGKKVSMICASGIMILVVLFCVGVMTSYCKNLNTVTMDTKCYTRELYNGIKEYPQNKVVQDDESENSNRNIKISSKIKIARLYTTIFLLRRFLIVVIITFMDSFQYRFMISSLILLQIIYLIFTVFARCFNQCSDQFCEITSESIFLVLTTSLSYLTTKAQWSSKVEFTYIGLILFNSI